MQAINNAMMPLANMIISQVIGRWFVLGLFEGTIGISLQRLTFQAIDLVAIYSQWIGV